MRRVLRRIWPKKPLSNIHFKHHAPTPSHNLGDTLCSPRHYFKFTSTHPALILGGGVYKDLGREPASRVRARVKVAWGVGRSFVFGHPPDDIDIGGVCKTFDVASIRDPSDVCPHLSLVPCVSVLHPIVDTPLGSKIGLFINQDPNVSGSSLNEWMEHYNLSFPDNVVATNALDGASYALKFRQTSKIITNSYHAAYWALLSGRGVKLIGYSTKFTELMSLFGLPATTVIRYQRGDKAGLQGAILDASNHPWQYAPSSAQIKAEFRQRNLEFASRLSQFGIQATIIRL